MRSSGQNNVVGQVMFACVSGSCHLPETRLADEGLFLDLDTRLASALQVYLRVRIIYEVKIRSGGCILAPAFPFSTSEERVPVLPSPC